MAKTIHISDHFDGRRFHNVTPRKNGFFSLLRWLVNRRQGEWKSNLHASFGPKPLAQVPSVGDAPDAMRITLVNHSTFLIQCFGVNILTDPMWSERASPVSWWGPRRMRSPGIRLEDLPRIHAVLLSHDHYDHMDAPTLRYLWKAHRSAFFTGLGNVRRLRTLGIELATEMDWWESLEMPGGLKLTCTPAQHFSGRTPFDRDSTLWCSFMIEPPQKYASSGAIYFAADTAFGPHFAQIAERFPMIRVAMLPIGAYRPEWFMGEVHCSPAEAVEAHRILNPGVSLACHFGTFPLADDGEVEPLRELEKALKARPVEGEFVVQKYGEPMDVAAIRRGAAVEFLARRDRGESHSAPLVEEHETMSGTED